MFTVPVLRSELLSDEHAGMLRIMKQTSSSKVVTTRHVRGDHENLEKLQKRGNENHADFDQFNNEIKQKKFPSERTGEVGLAPETHANVDVSALAVEATDSAQVPTPRAKVLLTSCRFDSNSKQLLRSFAASCFSLRRRRF